MVETQSQEDSPQPGDGNGRRRPLTSLSPRLREAAEDQLHPNIETTEGGCWAWTGHINEAGYGDYIWFDGRRWLAHRLSYVTYVGDIPEGLEIDHRCRNRRCVNPDHLEAVTSRENVLRAWAFYSRDLCKRGHLYTEGNLYINGKGQRRCRACVRAYNARKYAAKKLQAVVS